MSRVGRIAALAAVVGAIVLVAIVLFGSGGGGYTVTAKFVNASQLVKGNLVQIGGTQAGTVKDVTLTPDGQAEITMSLDETYVPLREGTQAVIRQASLSGIANKYVDLTLPPGDQAAEIPEGGEIRADNTQAAVELDSVFNTFDPIARVAVEDFFKGSARQFRGRGEEANRGYQYLNPALSASSRLFRELNRDTPVLENFLVDSARLVTTLSQRRDDLAALIGNLNTTTRALGDERLALAEAIARFPDFMRQANTTFVNLRSTLDTLDPLVEASEPVVSRPGAGNDLQELLPELRRFTADAEPTVADLDRIILDPGRNDDLIDLQETFPEVASTALDTRNRTVNPSAVPREGNRATSDGKPRDVGRVEGAFPALIEAIEGRGELSDQEDSTEPGVSEHPGGAETIAFGRPYTPELFGWFDDFSHTGGYDAVGGISRSEVIFNENSLSTVSGTDTEVPEEGQFERCPGAAEVPAPDGSNVFSDAEQRALECTEEDRGTGNIEGDGSRTR